MINWNIVEEHFKKHIFYDINNNKPKTIVMFGNCHMLPISYFFNLLTLCEFNIIVILSWFYERTFEDEKLSKVKKEIENKVKNCDIFIYQNHFKSYGIDANIITEKVKPGCFVINIPNIILDCFHFNIHDPLSKIKEDYNESVNKLYNTIIKSDFNNFVFILTHLKQIRFFNTKYHPTHFLLYLLTLDMINLVKYKKNYITIDQYYDQNIRNTFITSNFNDFVFLPDKWEYNEFDYLINQFSNSQDYFDIRF